MAEVQSQMINIGLVYVGKEICVEVRFDTSQDVDGAYVQLTVPPGVEYSRTVLPRGTYNPVNNTWTIGTVLASESVLVGMVCFSVSDDSYPRFPFTITGGAEGACVSCLSGNVKCITYIGLTCVELEECPSLIRNIYDIDGVQSEAVRTWDGDNQDLEAINWQNFNIVGNTPGFSVNLDDANGTATIEATEEVNLDSAAGIYKLVTSPITGTSTGVIVYNTLTGELELNTGFTSLLGFNFTQLTADNATLDLVYFGATAPTSLTELPTGTFTLVVPSGTILISGVFVGDNGDVDGSSQWTFVIEDTDGRHVHFTPTLIDLSTYAQKDPELNGHNPTQDDSVAGEITSQWQNMGYDDFKILFSFVNRVLP